MARYKFGIKILCNIFYVNYVMYMCLKMGALRIRRRAPMVYYVSLLPVVAKGTTVLPERS